MNIMRGIMAASFFALIFCLIYICPLYAANGKPESVKNFSLSSYQETINKMQEEIDKTNDALHQAGIDSFNRSSDAANRLISWVGIVATIYGIIIAIASLFVGYVSIRNKEKSEEALATLEGAKVYINKQMQEFDEIVKIKNEEINRKFGEFIKISLEQLAQDAAEATKKVKEIGEKGITTEDSKKIELLERKIKIFEEIGMPDDPKVLYSKAWVCKEKGELQVALELLHKAIQHDPKYKSAYFEIGYIEDSLGQFEKAVAAYDKAIELDSTNSSAWNNRGVSLGKLGRAGDALKNYNKAIELKPDEPLYIINKIDAIDKNLENLNEIMKSYDALIKIEPDEQEHYLEAGRLLATLGKLKDSNKYYQMHLVRSKKKVASAGLEEDHLSYFEALVINEEYKKANSYSSKIAKLFKNDSSKIIYTLLSSYLLFIQGDDEQAIQRTKDAINLIRNGSYDDLNWNFDDINPFIKNKFDEKRYQYCLSLQKAALKEVSIDTII